MLINIHACAQIENLHHVVSCSETDSFVIDLDLMGAKSAAKGTDPAMPTFQVIHVWEG